MTREVPSPLHRALRALSASIQRDRDAMAGALEDACQRMASGAVWVGSAAEAWNSELTGRSSDLARSISGTVAEVASALSAIPAMCSPELAMTENILLARGPACAPAAAPPGGTW